MKEAQDMDAPVKRKKCINFTQMLGADKIEKWATVSIIMIYLVGSIAVLAYLTLFTDGQYLIAALSGCALWGTFTAYCLFLAKQQTMRDKTAKTHYRHKTSNAEGVFTHEGKK
jgi:hypothetical protein